MTSPELDHLKRQLSVARKEIQNLRKQMKTLTMVHQKDLQNINGILKDFRCQSCKLNDETNQAKASDTSPQINMVSLKPIGFIRTIFPEKRAVPRQSSIGSKFTGCVEISPDVFNNPEHSIDGLQEFSHMWIIYHFHRNSSHPKSKVAPPRLSGERVGVFSTRSPHRPCPIGLSLVEIEKMSGSSIYFFGTDMVDGTPVFDIKPYIPMYDSPIATDNIKSNVLLRPRPSNSEFFNSREEPDGEETIKATPSAAGAITAGACANSMESTTTPIVKVPNWINSEIALRVLFNDRAENQLNDLQVDKNSISEVLKTDPRSVYLRTKYGSQIFTFQLSEVTVTCKFDDQNGTVTVVQVRKTENLQNGTN